MPVPVPTVGVAAARRAAARRAAARRGAARRGSAARGRRGRGRRGRWRRGSSLDRCGRRLGGRRRGHGRAGRPSAVADHGEFHADLDGLALGNQDLGEDAGGGRGHLGVDLVGRDLEERLVPLDRVTDRLHPAGDRALGHRLTELRHHHVRQGGVPFRSRPASSRRRSRTMTGVAGGIVRPLRGRPPS